MTRSEVAPGCTCTAGFEGGLARGAAGGNGKCLGPAGFASEKGHGGVAPQAAGSRTHPDGPACPGSAQRRSRGKGSWKPSGKHMVPRVACSVKDHREWVAGARRRKMRRMPLEDALGGCPGRIRPPGVRTPSPLPVGPRLPGSGSRLGPPTQAPGSGPRIRHRGSGFRDQAPGAAPRPRPRPAAFSSSTAP